MTYTIVYEPEDQAPATYGTFRTREAAQKIADKWRERDLDPYRDPSGGGVGHLWVSMIQPLTHWENS